MRPSIRHILEHCGGLASGELCLVVADDTTRHMAEDFAACARGLGANARMVLIPTAERHGVEPPPNVAQLMTDAHLILGLTKMSMAHTRARERATAGQGRYLSLPGYTAGMLEDPCVVVDYKTQYPLTRAIAEAFSAGNQVRVKTAAGTDVHLAINGRVGNCCPGFVDERYRLGSPPDIEANVSPVEEASHGTVVVDGSIACEEVGLLSTPVVLKVDKGRIVEISSENLRYVEKVKNLFARVGDERAYVLAECGVGLNPAARLTGNMLTDEGALGCMHFGFGSNATVGGKNDVPFHVDFVFKEASLWIDQTPILRDGIPCFPGDVI
jgi:leucyl aminopeptidase (aminopeptidase T)